MIGDPVDVLVVGAGPTGLTLAAELARHGVAPRVVDRAADRVHESRALAIQPRSLEVLAPLGVTEQLIKAGNRAVRLRLHGRGREVVVPLFDLGLADSSYPYLLFLSQAETERVLENHLAAAEIPVERRVELTGLRPAAEIVEADLRHEDGRIETVRARYVVGCDGARSAVRTSAGIPFEGSSYPQTFVLADCQADGLEPDAAHAFISGRGLVIFFPLVTPAPWRLLAMRRPTDRTPAGAPVALSEVETLVAAATAGAIRVHDPVWMTNFRLHHRAARRYRAGRVFVAGDAAHIHSPAGAQGMNTGIQDAVNLGWKLAYVVQGQATPEVLNTYASEREPIGRMVLRFTDWAFTAATSANRVIRFARARVAPLVLPLFLGRRRLRAYAFRTVSQLAIRYRRSPLSTDGPGAPRGGPAAGDRLPDVAVVHNGQRSTLHEVLTAPGWHLIAVGPELAARCAPLGWRYEHLVTVHRLTTDATANGIVMERNALRRLGLNEHPGLLLVRPDGHVGYRGGSAGLPGLEHYLSRWLIEPGG